MRANSRVVSTRSTSGPAAVDCMPGSSHSAFFATQGMMETLKIFSGARPRRFASQVLLTAPNICCGDFAVDRRPVSSGYWLSLIHILCGKVNKDLVTLLEKAGGRGVGLGGMDGGMFQAKRLTDRTGTDYGYVGDIVEVNPAPVIDMLEKGYIPVVSTVAQGIDDETNYNINADTAACKLAVALGAKKLILLTDVRGLMLDPEDESTLLRFLKVSELSLIHISKSARSSP